MKLTPECQACIDDSETLFDFMSSAIERVCDNYSKYEHFIDTYVDGNEEFVRFGGLLACLIKNDSEHYVVFGNLQGKLNNLIGALDSESNEPNSLALLYSILRSIDDALERDKITDNKLGPLDSNPNNRFKVFWFMPSAVNNGYEKWIHRSRSESSSIHKRFKHFCFFDSTIWKMSHNSGIPRGIIASTANNEFITSPAKRTIKIGISPFCVDKNFEFEKFGAKLFRLKYHEDQKRFVSIIDQTIEKVIENKCDIFVLPEFLTSPEVQNIICKKIKEANEKGLRTPLLTFAGSQWTNEDNNVLTILDQKGDKIGTYYKYSPYRSADGTLEEGLKNPGKVCEFMGVDGIGVLLPSICRDTIDNDYTSKLVEELMPLFVIVPAWSTSSASFEPEFEKICASFFVSSVLGNACSAREKNDEIGHCRVVYKRGTIPGSKEEGIFKDGERCKDCDSGCLFIAEFGFGYVTNSRGLVRPTLNITRC